MPAAAAAATTFMFICLLILSFLSLSGVRVIARGQPGHGSRFIKETAMERLLRVIDRFMEFRKDQESKLEQVSEMCLVFVCVVCVCVCVCVTITHEITQTTPGQAKPHSWRRDHSEPHHS